MSPRERPPGDPWSVPIVVEQIPEGGCHRELSPDDDALGLLAAGAGLESLRHVTASFDLVREGQGRVRVTGRVMGRVGQLCIVTLEPIENPIDEAVDLTFAPPELVPSHAQSPDDGDETPDLPEPIIDGVIDLGRLATDVLYLAIDPYPRSPDAVFDRPVTAPDPDDHPFAALKALQDGPESLPKKPKDT